VVTYGAKTISLTKGENEKLRIFERKMAQRE